MSTMNFIKHLALIVFFLCFTVSSAQELPAKPLRNDGLTREYSIYIPSSSMELPVSPCCSIFIRGMIQLPVGNPIPI